MGKYHTETVYRNQLRIDELTEESRNAMAEDIRAFIEEHADEENNYYGNGVCIEVYDDGSVKQTTMTFEELLPIFPAINNNYGDRVLDITIDYKGALTIYTEDIKLYDETDFIPFEPLKTVYDYMEQHGCFKNNSI